MGARSEGSAVVRRTVIHYACGCSTTRIETSCSSEQEPAPCGAHRQPILKIAVTTEYARPAEFTASDCDDLCEVAQSRSNL